MKIRGTCTQIVFLLIATCWIGSWLIQQKGGVAPDAHAGPVQGECVSGDHNGDAQLDVSDAVYLLRYLFDGGARLANCVPGDEAPSFVYLVRHAERDSSPEACPEDCPTSCVNPDGEARAMRLADVLQDVEIDYLLGSELCRTWQTLAPTSANHDDMPIDRISDTNDVAKFLLARPPGTVTVVAHHSFSLHSILEGLGLEDVRQFAVSGSNYDKLFVVTLRRGREPKLQVLRYY